MTCIDTLHSSTTDFYDASVLSVTWLPSRLHASARLISRITGRQVRVHCCPFNEGRNLEVAIFLHSEVVDTFILDIAGMEYDEDSCGSFLCGSVWKIAMELVEDLAIATGSDLTTLLYCSDGLYDLVSNLTERDCEKYWDSRNWGWNRVA